MPQYMYKCKRCEHFFEAKYKIPDRLTPTVEPCPNCKEVAVEMQLGATPMGDAVRLGITRPSEGFKDVLRNIHESTPGSRLKDGSRYI